MQDPGSPKGLSALSHHDYLRVIGQVVLDASLRIEQLEGLYRPLLERQRAENRELLERVAGLASQVADKGRG